MGPWGASFAKGRQSLRRRGQPTKCRRSGLRPPTRGGSAREHPAEEVAVVPARPFGRVAHQLADACVQARHARGVRSEEHTSELQSLMRISYAVLCLEKKNNEHPREPA